MVVPQEISDRILAECMGRPQAYSELERLCDTVGGRISGTESGRKGEDWAFELLNRWGLENIHFEEFPVSIWTRGTLEAAALEPAEWQFTALAHGNAPTFADVNAHVLDVGHGERDDYVRLDGAAVGKVALCDEGVAEGHRGLHRSEKLRLAAEFGAVGLMIYSSVSGGLPRTGNCCKQEAPIPSMGVSQEDGLRLLRLMRAEQSPRIRIRMTNKFSTGTARNVIGEIRGVDLPDEIALAGAHLDSWDVAQGATDNGLGSAIVLEMARSLAALQRQPRRTLRFCIWAAEEIGLCGSRTHAILNSASLQNYVAVLNFDMTADPYGYWAPKRMKGQAEFAVPPGFDILQRLCAQLAPLGMRNEFRHKAALHSDHQPFMLEGVQALALLTENKTQGAHYYHSVGDTFDKVSLPAMARAAAVGSHTLWALAQCYERPFPRLTVREVRDLIDEANLYDALAAEDYAGPLMSVIDV